ncbi:alpha/beta fold hydrolase [Nocardioides sp. SYSU D00038]|uniref:alpha/beta fold hydrolase n=1 Tax=Nocardioides sp. SYSU D00038 TaxID=2812554 RepID=UPI001967FF5F|nr:alpha/beta fold hydrolase [Nocardioides sp. SYSU D00038]
MTETIEIPLDRVRLSALAWGPADGPLAVLLHGFPDTAWSWRHLGPRLAADGWRVVAPFLRGYGPSAVPADGCYAVGALVSDAVGVHTALGGDDRAVLVGHDWGAITANALGAHPRSPYARVVSMAVPPLSLMGGGSPGLLLRQARLSWYTVFNQLPVLPELAFERLVARLWEDWSPGHDGADDVARVLAAVPDRGRRSAVLGYYRAVPRSLRPGWVPEPYRDWHTTWDGVPTVPGLVLHGTRDGCLQPALAERAAARLPAGVRFVAVPDAGHFLQVEQPEQVGDLVAEFVRGAG